MCSSIVRKVVKGAGDLITGTTDLVSGRGKRAVARAADAAARKAKLEAEAKAQAEKQRKIQENLSLLEKKMNERDVNDVRKNIEFNYKTPRDQYFRAPVFDDNGFRLGVGSLLKPKRAKRRLIGS